MTTTHPEPATEAPEQTTTQRRKGLLYTIGFWIRAVIVVFWFLFSSAYGLLCAIVKPGDPTNGRRFSRLNSWLARHVLGLRIEMVNAETLWNARPCVIVTNHQVNEDVFIHGWVYTTRTVVTGKRELRRIPMFGWMFEATGNILLDRSHHKTAVQQLGEAADRIRTEGISVWIFPEGHRNRKRDLLPFKRGAFHLAVLAGVPIVPVATQQYLDILDFKNRNMHGGTIHVEALEPIPTAGLTEDDVPALALRARAAIAAALERMGPAR